MAEVTLLHGNCLDILPTLEENSVDSIITDPPYGLSKEPDIVEVLQSWLSDEQYKHNGSGFAGKKWDSFVPGPHYWEAVYRVLKPGGMCLVFGGTRTFEMACIALRLAGFERRDTLSWNYGIGFPKSHDLEKALRKRGHSEEAEAFSGYGTALKPAWDPIILAMKPREGDFAQNALEWDVAGLNIDRCRVAVSEIDRQSVKNSTRGPKQNLWTGLNTRGEPVEYHALGRWPANLVLDEKAAHMLDEQTGGGGASRFFYCAKASRSERTCNGEIENAHPTVKPLALMRWLCRLTKTPTGGVVLDPFMGSGSTGVAAILEGREFIGIELEQASFDTAQQRIGKARSAVIQLSL